MQYDFLRVKNDNESVLVSTEAVGIEKCNALFTGEKKKM